MREIVHDGHGRHRPRPPTAGMPLCHVEGEGHDDPEAARIGMWLFLFSEVFLFGGLFIAYAVYVNEYHFDFIHAARRLDKLIGAANTLILLTSSLTMALAVAALGRGRRTQSVVMASVTVVFALAFLVIKSFEWEHKFATGVFPRSTILNQLPHGEQLFFGLYFTMTGLHALHVLAGAAAIVVAIALVRAQRVREGRMVFLENVGLYWHLVDVIWIFLFPLFYLVR